MESTSRRYLEGFFAGLHARGAAAGRNGAAEIAVSEEKRGDPLDPWRVLLACAEEDRPPGAAGRAALAALGVEDLAPEGRDGCRLRLRAPGGRLRAWQLRELAGISQESAGGFIEVGERGGPELAVVGWREAAGALARAAAAGLCAVGGNGGVLLSPAAGIDPEEVLDVTPLALTLDALTHGENGSPRIGLDGGARGWPSAVGNDLTLRAVRAPDGEEAVFRVLLAGETVVMGSVPAARAASACAVLVGVVRRGGVTESGSEERAREALGQMLGGNLPAPPEVVHPGEKEAIMPLTLGMFPQRQAGCYTLVAAGPADGRWRSRALVALASLAETDGAGEARLWPGGVLVPGVAESRAEKNLRTLAEITWQVG